MTRHWTDVADERRARNALTRFTRAVTPSTRFPGLAPARRHRTRLLVAAVLLLASCSTTGCAEWFAENGLPAEISLTNDTDQTLTVTYRDRELRVIPPNSHAYVLPRPYEDDHCLIAPMFVTDPAGETVAQVDQGQCYGERPIDLTVEQDDLSSP